MNLMSVAIDDPATRGFANSPSLTLNVEFEKDKEVVSGSDTSPYLNVIKMAPKYFFGQGDQYNEWDSATLQLVLQSQGQRLGNKNIWVVWEFEMGSSKLLTFELYRADDCLKRKHSAGGAFSHKIDTADGSGLTLVNGWSSRGSAFSATGITPEHYMEVDLVSRGYAQGQYYAPVSTVRHLVQRLAGQYYEVADIKSRYDDSTSTVIKRKAPEGDSTKWTEPIPAPYGSID